MLNKGYFVVQKLECVPQTELTSFFEHVSNIFVESVVHINIIVAERDLKNEAVPKNHLSSVLSHEHIVLQNVEFGICV